MSDLTIRTNNHKYDILSWQELTPKEQANFDWIESSDTLTTDEAEFFRYRGWVYCLSDIMRVDDNSPLVGWDGYASDSYFSGIVVRYARDEYGIDSEHVICGTYYS